MNHPLRIRIRIRIEEEEEEKKRPPHLYLTIKTISEARDRLRRLR